MRTQRRRGKRSAADLEAAAARLAATIERKKRVLPDTLRPENHVRIEGVDGIWFGGVPDAFIGRKTTPVTELNFA